MRLSDGGEIPHLARGNAIKFDEHADFMERLADVMQKLPPGIIGRGATRTAGRSAGTT